MADEEKQPHPSPASARCIEDIVRDLSKPIAPRHIKTRPQGGAELSYIEWHVAAEYLDYYAAGWSWDIRTIIEGVSGYVTVHGALTIPTLNGPVTRHATGIEFMDTKSFGDPVSNAVAMAFKRACAYFGLARHLYRKETPSKTRELPPKPKSKPKTEVVGTKTEIDKEFEDAWKAVRAFNVEWKHIQEIIQEATGKTSTSELSQDDKKKAAHDLFQYAADLQDASDDNDPLGYV